MRRSMALKNCLQPAVMVMLALLFLWGGNVFANESEPVRYAEYWEQMRLLQFNVARDRFIALVGKNAEDREARFGYAIALLNSQPRTRGNVENSYGILLALVEESADDRVGLAARFFLARVEMAHREPIDRESARKRLLELADELPETLWGQLAALKVAPLLLYAKQDDVERLKVFDDLERRAKDMGSAMVRRPLFLTLARIGLDYNLPREQILRYTLAAEPDDLFRWRARADAYLQIAGLARELGRVDMAREYYAAFYDEFPRDNRHFMVGEILRDLDEVSTP